MKQHDVSSAQDVKKFRYVTPAKRETLPQQWSREFGSKSFNSKSSLHGVDLDSVWSIKKNISVNPTPQFSTTLPGIKKDTFPSGNSFYSRYKTSTSLPAKQNQTISSENTSPGKASWLKSAPYPNSVTSASPMQNSDDDEFDFEMPSSTSQSTKWGKPQTERSNQFTYSDSSTLGGASGPSLGKNSFGNFSRSSFQF